MTRTSYSDLQRSKDEAYRAFLDRVDPERIGLRIVCHGCGATSWIKLSERRTYCVESILACPRACGTHGTLEEFSSTPCVRADAGEFDLDTDCHRDGTKFATNGVIFRCPCCGVENPREVMSNLNAHIRLQLWRDSSPAACADLVAKTMSTFDGVMRASNRIAVSNVVWFRASGQTAPPYAWWLTTPHPPITSFQNVTAARDKLLPFWDMAKYVPDWPRLVLIVQKRHLVAHKLGVADEEYLRKSGDTSAPVGKTVTLTPDDVTFFADATKEIVTAYFGYSSRRGSGAGRLALACKGGDHGAATVA